MEPEFNPPMSGSNSICVATVLLDAGIIEMVEPITSFTLEAPGGLVKVKAECSNGKANRIYVQNLPSFSNALDLTLEIEGYGSLNVDTAFGGDSFVVVNADILGFKLSPDEAKDLATLGEKITEAANEQLNFYHPTYSDWNHFSFCHFCGPLLEGNKGKHFKSAVAIKPGKIDRSPTGTALSAKMAILHKHGKISIGDKLTAISIIGSEFTGQILGITKVGSIDAILPEISGRAWITGTHQHMLDPSDPWPGGYRISDTWGV
jgi:proline racemase